VDVGGDLRGFNPVALFCAVVALCGAGVEKSAAGASLTGVGAVFIRAGPVGAVKGSSREAPFRSGDASGVLKAAESSAWREFTELCALSLLLPGSFGFF